MTTSAPRCEASEPPLPWLSLKDWAQARYGAPIYRVPVDPGWGCPHRRPGEAGGGCTFCGEDSGRARQLEGAESVEEQVEQAVRFVRERYGEGLLQLYVQAYTATFASAEKLRSLIDPLFEAHPFVSLSLGTRPDCLPPKTLDLLKTWAADREVWVELGVQTCQDRTLKRINRRHSFADSRNAVLKLRAAGIRVCAHLMFGLPGESADDMFETLERVVALPVDGMKFHNLHVLRDTALGEEWRRRGLPVMGEEAWMELAMQLIRRTPGEIPLFRLFTDSPDEERLAPKEVFPKGRFLHELAARMRERGWRQGELAIKN